MEPTLNPDDRQQPLVSAITPDGRSGRPRILDDAKRQQICTLVAAGCGIDGAARHIGCVPNTIHREARRNPQFGDALRQALQTSELNPLNAVRDAAARHWRAAAWLLERTNPKQFARQDPEAIPIDDFHKFVEKLKSETVWHVQVRNQYLPLLGKLRRLAEKTQNNARIRRELPAPKPERPLEGVSRAVSSPDPNKSTTV
jgi:IS30 family transposase